MAKKNKQKTQIIVLGCIGAVVLIAAVAVCVVLMGAFDTEPVIIEAGNNPSPVVSNYTTLSITTPEPQQNTQQDELDAILLRSVMLQGTKIQSIDVSGMTKEQARGALEAKKEELCRQFSLLIRIDGEAHALDGENIIVSADIDSAVNEAYNLLREDTGYDSVMAEVQRLQLEPMDIELSYTLDETSVRGWVAGLATEVDTPPINASVKGTDGKNIEYTDEQTGVGIDQEGLVQSIMSAKNRSTIDSKTVELKPTLTKAMLQEKYVLRSTFTTSFKGSSSNRKFNIKKGAEMMNGTVMHPGDVFSCNDKLGVRNTKNGWKNAGAYVQGNVDEQPGGGVCQLSSTLYNAVVLGDLEIVSRKNHSMPVSYVDKGRDATINSVGNIIDFKFKNNTNSDLIVICYVNGNNVTFDLYGVSFKNDEYDEIKITTEKISTQKIEEIITEDPKQDVGYEKVTQEGTTGYVYKAYKVYYKDGKKVKTELLNTSTYKMYPTKITIGTKPTPEPSNIPTTKPSDGHTDTPEPPPPNTPTPTSGGTEETPFIPIIDP